MENLILDQNKFKMREYDFQPERVIQKPIHRVLMVEDEEESGLLVEKLLRTINKKVRITWVTTAEEAEKILKTGHPFDLIIADHFLEGNETGFELWKVCHREYRQTPFLMTSALEREAFLKLTDNNPDLPPFLQKPLRISDCKDLCKVLNDRMWQALPAQTGIGFNSPGRNTAACAVLMISIFLLSDEIYFRQNSLEIYVQAQHEMKYRNFKQSPQLMLPIYKKEISPENKLKLLRQERFLPKSKREFIDGRFEKYGHLFRVG